MWAIIILYSVIQCQVKTWSATCFQIVNDYSLLYGQLINCSGTNSRPFNVCGRCRDHYDNIKYLQNRITVENCVDNIYYRGVHINFIDSGASPIVGIWKHGFCRECYGLGGGHSLQYLKFVNISQLFADCMEGATAEKYLYRELSPIDRSKCALCRWYYEQLAGMRFSDCIDIRDNVQLLMSMWSRHFQCASVKELPRWVTQLTLLAMFCLILSNYTLINYLVRPTEERSGKLRSQSKSIVSQRMGDYFSMDRHFSVTSRKYSC